MTVKATAILIALLSVSLPCASDDAALVFEDTFDTGVSLDRKKWHIVKGNGCPNLCGFGNNELQTYTGKEKNLRLENGHLVLEAHSNRKVTSAKITTQAMPGWTYGRMEARMKLPAGLGTWPAFWMMPSDPAYGSWPKSGEIDIMEHVGFDAGTVHGTIHTETYNHRRGTQKGGQIVVPGAASAFHTYAVEWNKDSIEWFMDGQKYFEFHREDGDTTDEWPFDQPFHMILNLAIGGDWGGAKGVDLDALPARLEVDWVRVWQRQEE